MTDHRAASDNASTLSIGQCAALATIIEATAPKPGNVQRGADFEDTSYPDFIVAATIVAPIFERAATEPLGRTVLAAVDATQQSVATNTNLGTILLLAPLAKAPRAADLESAVRTVLANLTDADAYDVYEAIRRAQPGGLGRAAEADVAEPPRIGLVAAMRLAAEHDMVARQYAAGFYEVFHCVAPWLESALAEGLSVSDAVVRVHLRTMAEFPDSLIARRCGIDVAHQAAGMAAAALEAGQPGDEAYQQAVADLDFWLRIDGHRRNPGTSADLVAAGLFVLLRGGIINMPLRLAH